MTRSQAIWILVLLAAILAVVVHRSYFPKGSGQPRFDYWAGEGDKIDLSSLKSQGGEGWDCSIIPTGDPSPHRYIMLCKRPI